MTTNAKRRANQQNVRFLNFDIRTPLAKFDALVVLVDGNSESLLGFVLSDHILVKKALDLTGLW